MLCLISANRPNGREGRRRTVVGGVPVAATSAAEACWRGVKLGAEAAVAGFREPKGSLKWRLLAERAVGIRLDVDKGVVEGRNAPW